MRLLNRVVTQVIPLPTLSVNCEIAAQRLRKSFLGQRIRDRSAKRNWRRHSGVVARAAIFQAAPLWSPLFHFLVHEVLLSALHLGTILGIFRSRTTSPAACKRGTAPFGTSIIANSAKSCWQASHHRNHRIRLLPKTNPRNKRIIAAIRTLFGPQDIHKILVSFRQLDASLVRINE